MSASRTMSHEPMDPTEPPVALVLTPGNSLPLHDQPRFFDSLKFWNAAFDDLSLWSLFFMHCRCFQLQILFSLVTFSVRQLGSALSWISWTNSANKQSQAAHRICCWVSV